MCKIGRQFILTYNLLLLVLFTVCFFDDWLQTKCKATRLTPVSDPTCYALSYCRLNFAICCSFLNHFLIGKKCSIANQKLWNRQLLEVPCHGEQNVGYLHCEKTCKSVSETGVMSNLAFCLGPFIEKTNSGQSPHITSVNIVWQVFI